MCGPYQQARDNLRRLARSPTLAMERSATEPGSGTGVAFELQFQL